MRDLVKLMQSFLGIYTEDYCNENNLFIIYDEHHITPEYKTRKVISLHEDIIETDLNFILGEFQSLKVDGEKDEKLNKILKENNWNSLKDLIILQGLILGTTGIKVGRDKGGNIKIGLVNLIKDDLEQVLNSNGETQGWLLKYRIKNKNLSSVQVEEYFGKDFYWRKVNDKYEVPPIVNNYGIPWLFVIRNKPSLNHDFLGIGEWENYRQTVDEINSSYSRMSAIEDIYASPKFIVSGVANVQIEKKDKVWVIPNENGDIKILEYQGNVMDSILSKIEHLEQNLRNKAPELMLNDLGNISGYALRLKMQKLEKKINKLRDTYFSEFKKVFALIYKMETGTEKEFNIEYSSDLVIPKNEEELMKKVTTLRGLGAISLQTALSELNYDYEEEQRLIRKENSNIPLDSDITE